MKHFLTYFLLLVMAVYAIPHVHVADDTTVVLLEKEKEEKSENKGKEEKDKKEVITHAFSLQAATLQATAFNAFTHALPPSLTIAITIPPPDGC